MTAKGGTPAGAGSSAARVSFRDLAPLEEGGRTAREGFDYQDHIAVSKCLDMLLPNGPSEVWCEAEDDIMLVWPDSGDEEFELVQVKGANIGQAWTVARLCAGEGKGKKSIVEKSLAHDRGLERCRFRVVTTWAPDDILDVLHSPLSARTVPAIVARLATATAHIEKQVGVCTSPNGNALGFWVERAEWEHRASAVDVRNENLVKLHRMLTLAGEYLAPDQLDELHAALYAKVQDAALADGITHRAEKQLSRDSLRDWLLARATKIQHPTPSGGISKLVKKLSEAGVDSSGVEVATLLRRRYAAETREPKYLTVDDRETIECEVTAVLHALKVGLDAGKYCDTGGEFLERCQEALRTMRQGMSGNTPSDALLYGCMYEVMNRCLHRLVRVQP